jgi:predicted P-loop ATPase
VLIWESFADPESDINYWSKDRYDVFPKVCIMAEGAEQKTTMGDLIAMIDSAALERAVLRINESDDDAEPRKPVKARPIKRAARPVRRK